MSWAWSRPRKSSASRTECPIVYIGGATSPPPSGISASAEYPFRTMPRAIWSGAISFGLVNIPVKLYSAVSRKTVRFHQLDRESNQRIQQKRVNPETAEEVPTENLVKGYGIVPARYVVITPEELEAVEPEKTRTIDIQEF